MSKIQMGLIGLGNRGYGLLDFIFWLQCKYFAVQIGLQSPKGGNPYVCCKENP